MIFSSGAALALLFASTVVARGAGDEGGDPLFPSVVGWGAGL